MEKKQTRRQGLPVGPIGLSRARKAGVRFRKPRRSDEYEDPAETAARAGLEGQSGKSGRPLPSTKTALVSRKKSKRRLEGRAPARPTK